MTTTDRRIPSLDGLRALSIAAVLLGHLTGTLGFPSAVTPIVNGRGTLPFAHTGVRVFFVISGFLITGLLLHETERTGTIDVPRFYLRRTLRIFPAYIALLVVLVLLDATGVVQIPTRDFWHAWTYTMNYDGQRVWDVGHLWSLAVEEQFYLVWPAVVLLAGSRRSALRIALGVIVVAPIIRVIEASTTALPSIDTSFDAIAAGCVLALSRDTLMTHAWYRRAVASRWIALVLIVAGLVASIRYRPGLLIGETLMNVGIALAVDRCVRRPTGRFGRLLNARPVVWIGTLSYSLYLWQQPFINRTSHATVATFPLNIALAVLCGLVSYYAIERPMLGVRPTAEAWLRRAVRRDTRFAGRRFVGPPPISEHPP